MARLCDEPLESYRVLPVGGRSYADYLESRPGQLRTTLKRKAKKVDVEVPRDEVRIRMIGLTPDIQALTRFMRQLEASPFFGDVQLNNSQLSQDQGKDVTQFTLDVTYTRPDTSVIKRVPLSASEK